MSLIDREKLIGELQVRSHDLKVDSVEGKCYSMWIWTNVMSVVKGLPEQDPKAVGEWVRIDRVLEMVQEMYVNDVHRLLQPDAYAAASNIIECVKVMGGDKV